MVAYLAKSDDNTEFHQIVDFLSSCSINYALTVSLTIYSSYIEQFWNTATSKTINSVKQIHAIVDGKAVVISESSVRSNILFDDEDGIICLTNDIFENLALMGYEPLPTKLTFQKGIKKEYSNARTPQQNRVVERKNMTLIKAARTMIADSLLPITFWAEAVNNACYVLSRALVTKTHNKTPYDLLNGRTPRLDFMRPFSCLVTILNTLDPLGKFEVKDDESSDDKAKDDKTKDDTGSKTIKKLVNKEDQAYRDELDRIMSQEKEASDAVDALRKESKQGCMDPRGAIKAGSTNLVNTVSNPVNAASTSGNFSAGGPTSPHPDAFIPSNTLLYVDQDDSKIPNLEDTAKLQSIGIFNSAYDDDLDIFTSPVKSVGAEADFNNMKSSTLVYRNKKDKMGIVVRNKARLVAQGHIQEEGIDYDEVFAHVAWIEAIRMFIAFTSFMGFIVYQMDVKSAFLYGTIKGEVQDKYVAEILKKFDFSSVKIASTPIETHKPLVKDKEAEDVDVQLYKSMIGSLMYLTASRPDIMFAVCACFKFQVTPKLLHLHTVKRIFRYLKGQPKLGLWYPRDSLFDMEAYSDSDYAGTNLDRKSTTRCCQFLGRRLIS
nr:hypothetical protein [Tanacetum cinerariifolium]